jgi:hypothetical protein
VGVGVGGVVADVELVVRVGLAEDVAVADRIVVVADVGLAGDVPVVGQIGVVAGVGPFGAVGRRLGVAAWQTAWFGKKGFEARVGRSGRAVAAWEYLTCMRSAADCG